VQREEQLAEQARKEEEKRLQKSEQLMEKERARAEKEEQRKSKDQKPGRFSTLFGRSGAATGAGVTGATGVAAVAPINETPTTAEPQTTSAVPIEGETIHDQVTSPTPATTSTPPVVTRIEPASSSPAETQIAPTTSERKSTDGRRSMENRVSTDQENDTASSPKQSRVKSWMNVHFRSKSSTQKETEATPAVAQADAATEKGKTVDRDETLPRTDSMRDVAMAGRTTTNESDDMYSAGREVSPERSIPNKTARSRSPSISSLSSDAEQDYKPTTDFSLGTTERSAGESEERGRSGFKQRLLKKIKPNKEKTKDETMRKVMTNKSNTTDDEFEEARDQFEEEKLAPPPPLSTLAGESGATKTVSPLGSRERSRFTEEL